MLTLPDFKEKKIILIQAEKDIDQQIRFWNSNVRLYKDGEYVDQISCYLILCIFIIGNTSITTTLIQKAKKYGISIFLLNYSFKQYAELVALAEGNCAVRGQQYSMSNEKQLEQSKKIIENKILNQIKFAQKVSKSSIEIDPYIQKIASVKNIFELLGVEGNCASEYFQTIFKEHGWNRRAPQTKEDITNFLMDIGYTYLFNYVDAILRLFGFDTYKGFYHQLFFQRKSLSCDLVEVFRPIIDKTILKGYNLQKITEKDFIFKYGAYQLKPDSKLRSKYSLMFFDAITDHKEEIYKYLRQYYLHQMNSEKYQFPTYIFT